MTETATQSPDRLTLKTKLSFGVGSAAEAIALHTITAYAVLFYNQVLGLPAHMAGIAVSVSLVLDGVIEPMAGSMSDRTRSRSGAPATGERSACRRTSGGSATVGSQRGSTTVVRDAGSSTTRPSVP